MTVPESANRPDWPRLVARAVNAKQEKIAGLGDYVDDTAAAAGGVLVGGLYRTGSVLKIRIS